MQRLSASNHALASRTLCAALRVSGQTPAALTHAHTAVPRDIAELTATSSDKAHRPAVHAPAAVSYTHLTLPTICSV
eukprot:3381419-Alexandrium_andersonii.AAC.1